jgi:hypothetical protein
MNSILEGRPALRATLYWINTGAIAALALVVGWFEATQGSYPGWVDTVAKALLGVGALVNITAGTNIRGDAIDPTAFPPAARKWLNYVFGGLQAAILLSAIIFQATEGAEPIWVDGLNAVLLVASGILSGAATSHVVPSPPPADEAQPEKIVGEPLFP